MTKLIWHIKPGKWTLSTLVHSSPLLLEPETLAKLVCLTFMEKVVLFLLTMLAFPRTLRCLSCIMMKCGVIQLNRATGDIEGGPIKNFSFQGGRYSSSRTRCIGNVRAA